MGPNFAIVTGRRYTLEVLDQLSGGTQSVAQLSSALHLPRRVIIGALRALIVGGLVRGGPAGSWDHLRKRTVPPNGEYTLTESGRCTVSRLSSFAVWQYLLQG